MAKNAQVKPKHAAGNNLLRPPCSLLASFYDLSVPGSAPAEIGGECRNNLLSGRFFVPFNKSLCGHQRGGNTKTALNSSLFNENLLKGVERSLLPQPFLWYSLAFDILADYTNPLVVRNFNTLKDYTRQRAKTSTAKRGSSRMTIPSYHFKKDLQTLAKSRTIKRLTRFGQQRPEAVHWKKEWPVGYSDSSLIGGKETWKHRTL